MIAARVVTAAMCLPGLTMGQNAPYPGCPNPHGQPETQTERTPRDEEVSAATTIVATDGISGYTTYQASVALSGTLLNAYTIAGSQANPMQIPPAYQVDAPFGTNTGGTNPAYWAYNAECQFDSWLTVGVTDAGGSSSSMLGNIGINFAGWTENAGMSIDDGAVFWMSPSDAVGGDDAQPERFVVAQFTIPTGTPFSFTVGEMQGRSIGWDSKGPDRVEDWRKDCITWESGDSAPPCPLTNLNLQSMTQQINDKCCGGHRRLSEGTCALDVCARECADIFLPIYDGCNSGTFGYFVSQIPEASSLAQLCRTPTSGR